MSNLFDLKFEGNLGVTPELRHTKGGKPVCDLRVAVNRDYVDAEGEKVENTHWYKVTVWGRQAETCAQYLEKGRMVRVIVGRVASEAWMSHNKDTGKAEIAHRPVFHASRVDFLGGAPRVSEGAMDTDDFGDDFGYPEMDTEVPTQPIASIPATPAPKGKRKSAKRGVSVTDMSADADFAGLDAIPF
jgi:single-stranded DNA-binding protein